MCSVTSGIVCLREICYYVYNIHRRIPTYTYIEVFRHIEVCLYIGRSVPIKRKVRVSSGTISDSDLGGAVKLGVTDV